MVEIHASLSAFLSSAILIIVFCIVTVLGKEALARGELWALFVLISSAVLCSVVTVIIWQQPESKTKLSFKVSGSAQRACRGPPGTTAPGCPAGGWLGLGSAGRCLLACRSAWPLALRRLIPRGCS